MINEHLFITISLAEQSGLWSNSESLKIKYSVAILKKLHCLAQHLVKNAHISNYSNEASGYQLLTNGI